MPHKSKRLLLSLDGSERSLQTVSYACEEQALKGMRIVLLHVFNAIPEAYYDLEKEPKSVKIVRQVRSWEANQKKAIREYMEKARQMLIEGGHADTALSIKIRDRKKGIARDIIAEAQKGYDAVLIRRRGATALKNVVVGSVTNKLMEKLNFIPILVAGKRPVNDKILLAVDGSPCATRAVRFVAETVGRMKDYQIRLMVVVRGGSDGISLNGQGLSTDHIFKEAIGILTAAGFPEENISTKAVSGAISRAGAIVTHAEKGHWGTIVVGRRGLSRVKDFFMGRVSNKVVHAGRLDTVWIVT
ncbi:universal stress protein [uncultured Desulfosarcina sp.]|uniref:universal stress protein n=1 Tax=uncultured Desulfosarcina sp. TaxID=218289 RepID=UPI0029C73BD5|nr:universal stress protein [uncultured Desulfosarcina sp.]